MVSESLNCANRLSAGVPRWSKPGKRHAQLNGKPGTRSFGYRIDANLTLKTRGWETVSVKDQQVTVYWELRMSE